MLSSFVADLILLCLKNGSIAKKAKAGKKCIGITSPGNISGNSTSNGRVMLMGPIILKNDKKTTITFNIPCKFLFLNLNKTKLATEINTQPKIDEPKTLPILMILSKETPRVD